ncbi:energy-coupling factor transporter ATPase, partial [Candidatus Bathyarchaeota archaeon]|nr:energy-coupling factor transporter ATPase [Candidatus Bathyarchaeota archaeon]
PTEFFKEKELLAEVGIDPPQVTELTYDLLSKGVHVRRIPLTLEDAVEAYSELIKGEREK